MKGISTMENNWYIALELEFDPPVEDEAVIAAKIEEKRQFWAANFADFENGGRYRQWHRALDQIKKEMLGPDNMRQELAAQARRGVYDPVDKLLRTLGRKGSLTPGEVSKIAQKLKVSEEMVLSRASKLNIQVEGAAAEPVQEAPVLPVNQDVPEPVTGLTVKTNPDTRCNIISWQPLEDPRVRYVVVRSKSGWITNIAEGETIFHGALSAYTDKAIEPGIAYYYNVFTERDGLYSMGVQGQNRQTVNLFELRNVAISGGDKAVNITWDGLPKNATVEIYEVVGGRDKLVATSTGKNHTFTGLTNGKTYHYSVALSYEVDGRKEWTKSVKLIGTPDNPPDPIDTLRVKGTEGDEFEATWFQKKGEDVRLFCSMKKPKYACGDIVSLTALDKEMRMLQPKPLSPRSAKGLRSGEEGLTFRHNSAEILYIAAVVIRSGIAVFGSVARARKEENVTVKNVLPVNGKINIYIDTPPSVSGFEVLYRYDRFPTELNDPQANRRYIPVKQYEMTRSLVLDKPEDQTYYFTIFAEFGWEGDKDYSCGASYLFDHTAKVNITYSISVNKKFFGESSVVMEFTADTQEFDLPDLDVMSMVGNTPMFKARCQLFHAIPAQHVNGTLSVKIPLPKGTPRDTYIRPFFKDENAHSGSQLQLKLKSNYKIT